MRGAIQTIAWHAFRLRPLHWQFLVIMGLLAVVVWFAGYGQLQAHGELRLHDLAAWQPESYGRVLVFAPHPDDEVLAAGGVIRAALAADPPVDMHVVVVTNGDASFSTALLNGYNFAAKSGYLRLSQIRQQESLQALQALGLAPEFVQFWSFPDQGLGALWSRHWIGDVPYRSRYSGLEQTAGALNSPDTTPYTGKDLLAQVRQALAEVRPDAVIMPHPQDAHPDHRAMAHFIVLAVALNQAEGWSPPPRLYAYAMWLNTAPRPVSVRLDQEVQRMPARFDVDPAIWLRFSLSSDVQASKVTALEAYQSQKRSLKSLLRSAGSGSELFSPVLLRRVSRLADPAPFPSDGQWEQLPYRREWVLPGFGSAAVAPTSLWSVADSSGLQLAAQLPRLPRQGASYVFVLRTVSNGETTEQQIVASQAVRAPDGAIYVFASAPLTGTEADGAGQVFALSLVTRLSGQSAVAHSDWQLLRIDASEQVP